MILHTMTVALPASVIVRAMVRVMVRVMVGVMVAVLANIAELVKAVPIVVTR